VGANSPSALKEFHEAAQVAWFGRTPLVYTRGSWWDPIIAKDVCGSNPLWVAHYTTAASPLLPKKGGWATWKMWQYSSSGRVDGIAGNVDMDRFDGMQADVDAFFYFEGGVVVPPAGDLEARLASLEAKVVDLGNGYGAVVADVDALEAKLAAVKAAL
jgi:hypothetical protein